MVYTRLFLLLALSAWMALSGCSNKQERKDNTKPESVPAAQAADTVQYDRYWNDLARLLAGLEPLPGNVLDSLQRDSVAAAHRRFMDDAWKQKETILLDKLEKWSGSEFPREHAGTGTVFYPFGGPDFVTINTLFPKANRYVHFGLEPEGDLQRYRKLNPKTLEANLKNIERSLDDILKLSFFVTKAMIGDLSRVELNGVTPLFLLFMARNGNEVLDVKRVKLLPGGKIANLTAAEQDLQQRSQDTIVTGMEFKFRKSKDAPIQTLHYFSFDAQDIFLKNREQDVLAFFRSLAPTVTYVKSASYLMHWGTFSIIRNTVLDVSRFILQDDTGIAYRYYDRKQWRLQLYGNYTGPINIFRTQFQRDLDLLFKTDTTVRPLDFGIGYKYAMGTSSLILARKVAGKRPPYFSL